MSANLEMTHFADRNLLFGLLAIQHNFIHRDALVHAFKLHVNDRSRPLDRVLLDRGDLSPARHALIAGLVVEYLKLHGDDPARSIASLGPIGPIGEELSEIADSGFRDDVAQVSETLPDDHPSHEPARAGRGAFTSDGRFQKLRFHARGGLGQVSIALDRELDRPVALKEIQEHHADEPLSRARFVQEAEITGKLEHPGIVPVYSLGHDANGRPFYAMRFIQGDSLKEAIEGFYGAESRRRGPGDRLVEFRELLRRFVDVCNAVAYAHSRGVLHRDLKPGNIMLGPYGETLVVDWGLAKSAGDEPKAGEVWDQETPLGSGPIRLSSLSGSRADTAAGIPIGTPAYASPEQVSGAIRQLGPASDVYGLGATLYSLLTGRPPVGPGDRNEVFRRVKSGEIPMPRSLDPTLPKALEAICLKAMALEPAGRYASAKDLALEVTRWLDDQPVAALRESLPARAGRWARHHRTTVAGAVAALLMALVGTAAVLAVEARANGRLSRANGELAAAHARETQINASLSRANVELAEGKDREAARFELAMGAINLFHGQVSEDLLLKEKPFEALRAKLLKGAAEFYGKLEGSLRGRTDPASLDALGRAYEELANLTGEIAEKPMALAMHGKALSVRRGLAARPGATLLARLDVARSLMSSGRVSEEMGDTARALATYREALELVEALPPATQADEDVRSALGQASLAIGRMLYHTGKRDESLASLRRAEALLRALVDSRPDDVRHRSALASCHNQLGLLFRQSSRPPEALAALERARELLQGLADADPAATRSRSDLAATLIQLGNLLRQMNRPSEAMASYEKARGVLQELADAYPSVSKFQTDLARSFGSIGIQLVRAGKPAEGLASLERARGIQKALADNNPTVAGLQSDLGVTELNLGQVYQRTGRPEDALATFERARAIQRALVDAHPEVAQFKGELALSMGEIGGLSRAAGKLLEAVKAYREGAAIMESLPTLSPIDCYNLTNFHARLAKLADTPGAGISAAEGKAEADIAMDWLRRSVAGGFRNLAVLRGDGGLEALRDRPDYLQLMADLAFPADPFAR